MRHKLVYFFISITGLLLIGYLGGNISFLLIVLVLFLISCSAEKRKKFDLNQLTKVKVRELNVKAKTEFVIIEEEDFDTIREAFEKVEWEPNTGLDIQGERMVEATFFCTCEENMPELLAMYEVYLMKEGSIFFQSEKEKEGYGELHKEDAESLKYLLF